MSITPGTFAAGSVDFAVVFSEPVTGFDEAADLVIAHDGTANSGVSISGSGAEYTVTISGISGAGSFTLAVSTASDVQDLASSVTSLPVSVESAFQSWAIASGLVLGVNDFVTDDPDGDDEPNLIEFATDGDPLSGTRNPKRRAAITQVGGGQFFTFTIAVRDGAVFSGTPLSAAVDGIVYSLSGSSDLTVFDRDFVEMIPALEAGLPALGQGWSYRTFQLLGAVDVDRRGFARVTVDVLP